MTSPTLSLRESVGVDSPVTILTPCINLGEFEEDASSLEQTFCANKMSKEQFNAEAETETEKALKGLIEHLESNPSAMLKLLQKRKQEEIENSGLLSLVKSRLLKKVQGDKYKKKLVTDEECKNKIEELSQGMMMVYSYAQEARGRRFSKRLAARQGLKAQEDCTPLKTCFEKRPVLKDSSNTEKNGPKASAPSCPPPAPPLNAQLFTSLKENNIKVRSPTVEQLKRPSIKTGSTGSLVSVHEELLSSNPLKKLRPVNQAKSPGGTPLKRPCHGPRLGLGNVDLSTPCALKHQEPLMQTFLRVFEEKFRNVRSPSPAANSSTCSPNDFDQLMAANIR